LATTLFLIFILVSGAFLVEAFFALVVIANCAVAFLYVLSVGTESTKELCAWTFF
jgi:hypothetical protein